jgi:ligand-binding SRPBCC domain-containing protein
LPAPPMVAGAVFDYRISWLGVPIRWRAFIREFDPPVRFVDVQVRGPYARWEHRHLFLEEAGGTWIEDRVTYRLPLGVLGRLAHAVVVQRQLAAIWRYRERRIGELVAPVLPGPDVAAAAS